MTRLWDKGGDLDPLVHRFTVGDDPRLDLRLLHFDCLGSAAHVRTLQRAEVLTRDEADRLVAELARIDALAGEGRFPIPDELEDGHTAIESHLTAGARRTRQKDPHRPLAERPGGDGHAPVDAACTRCNGPTRSPL